MFVYYGGGRYIYIINESLEEILYYQHLHKNNDVEIDVKLLLNRLDNVVKDVFDRFVKRLNGREVVLFLSGGYDSRLIFLNLLKRNYKNLVCISLVTPKDKDASVAKFLTAKFNVRMLSVNFTKAYWKNKAKDEKFWKFVDEAMNGTALHYLQGLVIDDFIQEGLISKNCVVVTGNSGDVVEGNDVCENFSEGYIYSKNDVVMEIINYHGVNFVNHGKIRAMLSEHINTLLPCKENNLSYFEAQDMFEYFNWIERQCKYVTSDARNYDDYIGVEWLLPLWDDEFVKYWQNVPMNLRYKRNLYYKYVKDEHFPTANTMTLFLKIRNFIDKKASICIKALYPIRQIIGYASNDIIYSYCGVVNIWEYMYLQYKTLGNKNKFITPVLYKFFKHVYNKNIFDLIREV